MAGFIQQVAVGYLARGYYFYVAGHIPEHKDPRRVDAKLIRRYDIDLSRGQRYRRKKFGLANVQYIRHGRLFLLMATHGRHRFFDDETGQIRDARKVPIRYAGYSISHHNGHASVRIDNEAYKLLKARLKELASRCSAKHIADEFRTLPVQPYAPVRRQLRSLLREANLHRQLAGRAPVPFDAIETRRLVISVFKRQAS